MENIVKADDKSIKGEDYRPNSDDRGFGDSVSKQDMVDLGRTWPGVV